MIARTILIILSLLAAGLYLRVLMPPEDATSAAHQAPQEATVQAAPKPLPEDQMQLVLQALAPEMAKQGR
jgi:hypothetical protein